MRLSVLRFVATLVVGLLVIACTPSASPSPATTRPLPSHSASAAAPASPSSLPSASPAPAAADLERPLGWNHIGNVSGADVIDNLLPLDDGYFAWGGGDFQVVWYSADGLDWVHSDLAEAITPCPGWTSRPDGEVLAAATNGDQVVLVGLEYAPNAATCGTWRAAAWVSNDGKSWQRAPGFGPTSPDNVWTENVWATPDGWEALMSGNERELRMWRSTDGLRWQPAEVVARGESGHGVGAHAADSTGTQLLVVHDWAAETSSLLMSRNGEAWHETNGPAGMQSSVSRLLAPDAESPNWMAVTVDDETGRSTVWTSTDLEHWQDSPFPMPEVSALAHTRYGVLALGKDPCRDTGGPCVTDPPQYFLSADGSSWTPLHAAVNAQTFIDGGAGVIGLGGFKAEGEPPLVWRLEPYSTDEAFLFNGLRDDARFACAPRRVDLPATAVAGVECASESDAVERIGVYRFSTQQDLLDTYFARMASYGLEPGSGSCPQGPGEHAYVPGDGPYRFGCYLNEFGIANYRFTEPDSLVYGGILGTGRDLEALHDWAWLGNLDTPGSPTVWQAPAR